MELKPYAYLTMGLLGLSSIVMLLLAFKSRGRSIIMVTFLTGLMLLPTLNGAWLFLDQRSVKTLAMQINQLKQPDDKVIAFNRYYQDLPPYINQQIYVVNWQGELEFGMSIEDTSGWMLTSAKFFENYHDMGKVYIVTRKECLAELEAHGIDNLQIIGQTDDDILLTNRP